MKFEKFLKQVGAHGEVLTTSNGEKWLSCDNVVIKVPRGVTNLLGQGTKKIGSVFEAILHADTSDDVVQLKEAVLFDPMGKARDIVRVFETDLLDRVGIYNPEYALLDRTDKLTYLEIEVTDPQNEEKEITLKYLVVLNMNNEVQGFIKGVDEI